MIMKKIMTLFLFLIVGFSYINLVAQQTLNPSQKGETITVSYGIVVDNSLDSSIQSKIVAMAFSMASEIERDLISQRTKEAMHYKKEHGIKLGRPAGSCKSKPEQYRQEIKVLLANGTTQRFIARRYQTTEANLFNWLNKNELQVKPAAIPEA